MSEDRQFGGHYRMWRLRRIRAIVDHYGPAWFAGKKVLELGCGHGDIGIALAQLGAEVTFSDARQEHLDTIAAWYPEIEPGALVPYDAEQAWPFTERYDLVLHLGLLYHVDAWERALLGALSSADHIVLETEVCDSDDPTFVVKTAEEGYDQAFGGVGSRPSAACIESLLLDEGCRFDRITDDRCNADIHRYDWPVTNSGDWDHGLRRFWFVDHDDLPGVTLSRFDDMIRGWFVGAFEPTAHHTDACEVAVKWYVAGTKEALHHHKVATEITAVVAGAVRMCGQTFDAGSIVTLDPGTATDFEALEDSLCVVVKTPGALNDKFEGAP